MKVTYKIIFVFFLLSLIGCVQTGKIRMAPGQQHHRMLEKEITKTLSCQYLLFLPEGYGDKKQKWPLILFLHGIGQCGNDLEKVKELGVPKVLEDRKDLPFIVVSPQCPEGEFWNNDVLTNLLYEVISRYAVDTDRIYVTGLSLGGGATWHLACEYPERFAAIAPVCGWGTPADLSLYLIVFGQPGQPGTA